VDKRERWDEEAESMSGAWVAAAADDDAVVAAADVED
jgi:hypothetical protein